MKKNNYLKYINYDFMQDDHIYKINTDTVILGMSFDLLKGKTLLDIGTNTGALLLYGHYYGAKYLYGVDINEKALLLADKNISKYTKDFKLFNSDIKDLNFDEKVDVIVCNPPFFEMNNVTTNDELKMAMFEESLPLDVLFKAYRRLLKDNGEVYMIYPADRFNELYKMIIDNKMKIMKLRFIHDENSEYALRVILKLKIGKMTKLRVLKPIIIKDGIFDL